MLTWYHGSQQELTKLRVGSSITQNRKVAVYVGHTLGRAEPRDLPAIVKMEPDLFYDLGTRPLAIEEVEQRGGILQERQRIPRSARLTPVGTASRLLELRRLHPELLQGIVGEF